MARLKRPSRLNGEGRSPSLHWPHSVAWISQWLAEPRTRVRIAVGPPIDFRWHWPTDLRVEHSGRGGAAIECLGLTYSSSFTSCTFSFRAALADAFRIGKAASATHIAMHTPQRYDISSVTVVTS